MNVQQKEHAAEQAIEMENMRQAQVGLGRQAHLASIKHT